MDGMDPKMMADMMGNPMIQVTPHPQYLVTRHLSLVTCHSQ